MESGGEEIKHRGVCTNKFCKIVFYYTGEYKESKMCPKCEAESGFTEWVDKQYEGERWDGMPHEIQYNILNYSKRQ